MAILFFFIVAATGFTLTATVLGRALRRGKNSHHQHSSIFAVGLGITWMLSFFAPFFAPGDNLRLDFALFLFGMAHSAMIGIVGYIAARLWLKFGVRKG